MSEGLPKKLTEEDFLDIGETARRDSEKMLSSSLDEAKRYREKIKEAIKDAIQDEFPDIDFRISLEADDAEHFKLHFSIPVVAGDDPARILALAKIGLVDAIDDEFFAIDDATWQDREDGVTADITFIKKQGIVKE